MSESVKPSQKKSEDAKEERKSQTRKSNYSQPENSPIDRILFLQRTIGNQAVCRLIKSGALQAKLRIGQPDDIYEKEADRVAEQVMWLSAPVQKKCLECEGEVHRQPKKEEETLQSKEISGSNPEVTSELETNISAIPSGGHPLPRSARAFFESRFGHDFSPVRVHTDTKAAESAKAMNAAAYTIGQDIVFNEGQYAPGTALGGKLLAHELMHVLQQKGQMQGIQKKNGTEKEPKLLQDFAGKFAGAADLIRKSESAMKLIKEADAAGVKFGGYAEDCPGKMAWPYTIPNTKTVYVPKARTDKIVAMSDFLFELNNAVRSQKLAELQKEGAKGTKGKLTAKEYAYKIVEQEVEGMLRTGEIWFEVKKTLGKDTKWDKYNDDFFLSQYKAFKEGKKTKEDIVKEVLKWPSGADKSKTTEEYYMEQYKNISAGK